MYQNYSIIAPPAIALSAVKSCPFWPAMLLIALFIPTEFSFFIGSFRLTLYRLILIVCFLPNLLRFISRQAHSINSVDLFIGLHILWAYFVYGVHHGVETSIESGGIRMLELGGGYLMARTYITCEKEFRGMLALIGVLLILLAPIVIFESVTGFHFIKDLSLFLTGNDPYNSMDTRGGFYRAVGPFDHPILLGVFAASALGVLWVDSFPRLGLPRIRRLPAFAAIGAAFSSISMGALVALGVQVLLMLWAQKTSHISRRWLLLVVIISIFYVSIDILSNRSGLSVLLDYLTFNSHTAFYRVIIFDWGMENVWNSPIIGIGFDDWIRPEWMASSSMDNLWLLQAVTFGVPGFITFTLPFLIMASSGWTRLPPRLTKLRFGWAVSLIGMMVAGCTVHFWNSLIVYFLFFLGAGAWFLKVDRKEGSETHILDSSRM